MKEHDERTVAGHWLPAIFNGDYSGLTEEEENSLENWLGSLPANASLAPDMDGPFFAEDEVTGLMADCYTVKVFLP